MIDLVLQERDAARLQSELLTGSSEGCAVLFTHQAARPGTRLRLLVSDLQVPTADEYLRRSSSEAELDHRFVAGVAKRALRSGAGLVFVHSHLGGGTAAFSPSDDEGEKHLARFLARRLPVSTHVALVMAEEGSTARVLGTKQSVRIVEVGPHHVATEGGALGRARVRPETERQVRAFGREGQRRLERLLVAVVGLGGTGSVVVQQLAHLGVRRMLLVDPDTVSRSNLNRLANATARDLGRTKVQVARQYVRRLNAGAEVEAVVGDVTRAAVARRLTEADFLFGCTDSHGSRSVLQQVAYQYLVPCIDMGTTIVSDAGRVTHVTGRVQMLAPGLPCFTCGDLLNANEVRRDMMTRRELRTDPYVVGHRVAAPAVMSINATVGSLAVTMFLAAVTGIPSEARHLHYDAIGSRLRSIGIRAREDCFVCSRAGVLGRGDSVDLMARKA